MERLKKRRDFLAAAKGRRTARRAFVMETRDRGDGGPVRFGFTVSKRTAKKAVERNRIRRRLKEAVRLAPAEAAGRGFDHVLVGRRAVLDADFAALRADLQSALQEATGPARRKDGRRPIR
ncbi:ribonuclease P protein component [Propylenella binzhouense]|uniref:Ribonuclease P protein component n=1 Tax=Propylenella binzhouense TaxID=2555902 RepID=A0A964T982_9HYPH|nr:ribonuclease P protein component [Propylenella binzhouense]MYZ49662.1 ribonuclease P protein component [Propylenella binzhouense]